MRIEGVRALVAGLRDIVSTLADADPEDKAVLYRKLNLLLRTTRLVA